MAKTTKAAPVVAPVVAVPDTDDLAKLRRLLQSLTLVSPPDLTEALALAAAPGALDALLVSPEGKGKARGVLAQAQALQAQYDAHIKALPTYLAGIQTLVLFATKLMAQQNGATVPLPTPALKAPVKI